MRTTIDFGIDLGTTNSKIAVFKGTGTEVFKNSEWQEYTPSAVCIDIRGRFYVGRLAEEQLGYDSENVYSEFKLQMGTPQIYRFARSGRQMRPEELSAEVLKSLRRDVQQHTGEEVMAAAITVPATFGIQECDATNKAARLAGLSFSPLLMEPVASALAYGFQSKSDCTYWMVYDFGGGTFDVAVIQVRDDQIQVVHHNGDNQLGGKLIDWEIVERLFVPALQKEYHISDFKRGNPKWKAAFAKLKLHAEQAKIRASRDTATEVIIEPLCQDDRGIGIRFEYELKRSDIVPLIEPFVERSINLCKKTLEEKKLSTGDIEKMILVGGPTLTPVFREILKTKLKIPLESSIDPLTVNARGVAIFAGTQPMPRDIMKQQRPVLAGQYRIELKFEPIGTDTEPLVGGKVIAFEGKSLAGFTIEFVESKTKWRSGKMSINAYGTFMTNVHAGGQINEFLIELRDSAGNLCDTVPDRFNYTLGMTHTAQALIKSIGVGLANEQMQIIFNKGTSLPARCREVYRTTLPLKKGESGTLIRIPVFEGDITKHADKNSLIGVLNVSVKDIRRDVPPGSDVEITIDIDESRLVRTRVYIPILDQEFENVLKLVKNVAEPAQLADELKHEKGRLEKVREQARQVRSAQADKSLQRIGDEGMIHEVEVSLAAAKADPDAADKCEKRLRDLKCAIDDAEDALEWSMLISEAQEQIEATRDTMTRETMARETMDEYGKGDNQRNFYALEALECEIREAIAAQDKDLLRQKIDRMDSLRMQIIMGQPGFWVGYFEVLERNKYNMRDQTLAERLITEGHRAIDNNDLNGLKSVVLQLNDLRTEAKSVKEKSRVESGSPEVPGGRVDLVHFSVASPPIVQPGYPFVVGIYAHLEKQITEVIQRAQKSAPEGELSIITQGPLEVERGTVLTVRLELEDFAVEPAEATILWAGEIGNATFCVRVPDGAKRGRRVGIATIHTNCSRVAIIFFELYVGEESARVKQIEAWVNQYRTAFASYASDDRSEVMKRIQGIQKAAPKLDIFVDVDSLRSGQEWWKEIQRIIPTRDVLYLFWSAKASESTWVEQEWRCALNKRGLYFIDPCPLVSPKQVPPPKELEKLHFEDRWRAYAERE